MANKDEESPEQEEPKEDLPPVDEDAPVDEEDPTEDEDAPVELTVTDGGKFDPEARANGNGSNGNGRADDGIYVDDMYGDWFLDYASYVILERAVPHADDGLKPVQRRILHSMREMEDGRYNKVANVIGNTMKYHPHGDASIGDAMVQIGQKELLIDPQGNWGNVLTGDSAAAARYIEARLTAFALEVIFSPKVTAWAASYDGRNKEPVTFPVKFPLLLAQGAEGIAVGIIALAVNTVAALSIAVAVDMILVTALPCHHEAAVLERGDRRIPLIVIRLRINLERIARLLTTGIKPLTVNTVIGTIPLRRTSCRPGRHKAAVVETCDRRLGR